MTQIRTAASVSIVLVLAACQADSQLMSIAEEPAGENCAAGGQAVSYGIDADGDGSLSGSEVSSTTYVCNGAVGETGAQGAAGTNALVELEDEAAGANCPTGGKRLTVGIDDDGDGVLSSTEADATEYLCNGLESRVALTDEAPGANCEWGGKRVDTGIDLDGNGALDAKEVESTEYVCNGADGRDTLVALSDEAAGLNCASGGERMDWGVDENRDGVLDSGEVTGTRYVCDGADAAASLLTTTAEAAGANCEWGGQRVDSGVDDDGDGVLDAGEIDNTAYVCDGSEGLDSLIAQANEPAGDNCGCGGMALQYGTDDNRDGVLDVGEIDGAEYMCEPVMPVGVEVSGGGFQYEMCVGNLLEGGWSICYEDTYDVNLVSGDITTACTGNHVLLGCSDDDVAPGILRVAAADTRAVVLPAVEDAAGGSNHRVSGPVGWYFTSGNSSMGFFSAGDGLSRVSADTADGAFPEARLSWHTDQAVGGYRCGATKVLNSDSTFSRYVLVHD